VRARAGIYQPSSRHFADDLGRIARVGQGARVDQEYVIVLTTVGVDVNAGSIASSLVDDRLAACVNVLPEMDSYFRWRGAVEQTLERQLVIKTTAAQLPALEARLGEIHPYELPEFLVLTARQAGEAYGRWIGESTRGAAEGGE
jgi:periplasmic divalent cation tolerance protein